MTPRLSANTLSTALLGVIPDIDAAGVVGATTTTHTADESLTAAGGGEPVERASATTLTTSENAHNFGADTTAVTTTPLTPALGITTTTPTASATATPTAPTLAITTVATASLTNAGHWYHTTDDIAETDDEIHRAVTRTMTWDVERDATVVYQTDYDRSLTVDDR